MKGSEWRDVGQLNIKKVLYISAILLAVAIVAFVIASFTYARKTDNNNVGKFDTDIIGELSATDDSESKMYVKVEDLNDEKKEIKEEKKVAVNTSDVEEKVQKQKEEKQETKPVVKQEVKKENIEETKKETVTTNTKPEVLPDPKFVKPVEGEIIKKFAKENLVYSNTLGEWTTHNGIDIKADKTTVIKAAEAGTVKYIKNDPRYGLTIVIEHNNGYKTIYSNLLSTEFVVENEKVQKGQAIGTVGTTSTFEILDDPHLHFEIMKNSEYLDPELYLK